MSREVAVTGVGIVCSIGDGAGAVWASLVEGKSGICELTRFPAGDMRSPVCAECVPFDEPGCEGLTGADRTAVHAAREAMESAGLDRLPPGAGVAVGTGVSGLPESEDAYLAHLAGTRLAKGVRCFTRHLPATMTDVLAKRFAATGPTLSVVNACSSSTVAIGQAACWIKTGETDIALAGSADILSRLTQGGFNILRVVSKDRPRPFDKGRTGMAIGEGGAFLVLENAESAARRGAKILAYIESMGLSTDGFHPTAPDPEGRGAFRAMSQALDLAGVCADEVDHINAHGTGTPPNDKAEGAAIKALLGARSDEVPVISVKGAVGHCLGAAGAIEAAVTVLSLVHQTVPPCGGFDVPDPDIPLYVPKTALQIQIRRAISLSLAFGGNNAALLLKRAG